MNTAKIIMNFQNCFWLFESHMKAGKGWNYHWLIPTSVCYKVILKREQKKTKQKETTTTGGGFSVVVKCLPLKWKVGYSIHGNWVNHRSVPWTRAFTPNSLSKTQKIQVSTCFELSSPKLIKKETTKNDTQNNITFINMFATRRFTPLPAAGHHPVFIAKFNKSKSVPKVQMAFECNHKNFHALVLKITNELRYTHKKRKRKRLMNNWSS